MRIFRRHAVSLALLSIAATAQFPAYAANLVVDANVRPWDWATGGINSDYFFGIGTPLAPVSLDGTSFGFSAGDALLIAASGSVSAGEGFAPVNPNGLLIDPGSPTVYAGVINEAIGDSGGYFPSRYTPGDWDTNLMALMGTFTDNSGTIVGAPSKSAPIGLWWCLSAQPVCSWASTMMSSATIPAASK